MSSVDPTSRICTDKTMTEQILTYILTLLSDRQQASNDDCLEDKSGDYQNSSVLLCTTVVHSDTDIYDQFLKLC